MNLHFPLKNSKCSIWIRENEFPRKFSLDEIHENKSHENYVSTKSAKINSYENFPEKILRNHET